MKHNYLNNLPLTQAQKLYFDAVKNEPFRAREERTPSAQALGRLLSHAVYAIISSPHYNASAMDGIAVKAACTYGAREESPVYLSPEAYKPVDTGDPLPDDTDAVVMIEDVINEDDGTVKLLSAVSPWQNVRQVGEDICMGDMIAPTGTRVTPALIGAFLAGGVTEVFVKTRPLFGIIPTGDEIVPPTKTPEKGEIIEFNSSVFSNMLREWGADAVVYDIVKDKKDALCAALENALRQCDAVLILAGSSAGRDDYTADTVARLGRVLVHGVSIKPGKPVVLGIARQKPVVGLPGYPVSAIVAMEQFVKGLTEIYNSAAAVPAQTVDAVVSRKLVSSLKYREFVRVSLGRIGEKYVAVPLSGGAGVITSFTKADGILEIGQNCEGVEAGTPVTVRLLRPQSEIDRALVVTGSHDPVIDEIADLMQLEGMGIPVRSSHVGSMGAIHAIRAGQAHMGAIHLLDPETGSYNTAYVRKYFPNGDAVLVKGVRRIQGFIVKKGNPLNIKGVSDLTRCRYVNRQRGAGTRVLLDVLLNKNGISAADVQGYGNEKYTHTAVAAAVEADIADVGLGIYSAAKMYALDFIPVCDEEYDFLVNAAYLDSAQVKAFFAVLHGAALRARLAAMGGYALAEEN